MNYNECGGCSGNGVNYGGTAVNAGAAYAAGGTCYRNADNYGTAAYYGNTTYANTASAAAVGGGCRNCNLYWQGYMAGFYANNQCNQSPVARTAAQAAGRTASAASTGNCGCNSGCGCGRCNSGCGCSR